MVSTATIAVICEATSNVLNYCCNSFCKKETQEDDTEDKKSEEDNRDEDEKTGSEESESEGNTKLKPMNNNKKKTRKKRSTTKYSAVIQNEPTTSQPSTIINENHVNPVFNISPYGIFSPNVPGVPQMPASCTGTEKTSSGALAIINQDAVEWIQTSIKEAGELIDKVVVGGYDIDESELWIIRSRIKGDIIPGKFNFKHQLAFAFYLRDNSYAERNVDNFQVCCYITPESRSRVRWIKCSNGHVPKNAVEGGWKGDQKLYIGRVRQNDKNKYPGLHTECPGMIHPSHGVLYITYDLTVYAFQDYEVFCIE